MIAGDYQIQPGDIELSAGPGRLALPLLLGQRRPAVRACGSGMRLNITAGTAVRLKPGQQREDLTGTPRVRLCRAADGQLRWCEPADVLPMTQRHFPF